MAESGRGRSDVNASKRQGGGGRKRSRSPVERSKSRKEESRDRRRGEGGNPARILVKNLPYEVKWQIIKDTFRREVGDVAFVDILEGPDGKSKGIAMIEFKNKDHAKKAIEKMHRFKIGDREIVVREERERDRIIFERRRDGDRGEMGDDMGRALEMRGQEMDLALRGLDMGRGMDLGMRGGLDLGMRGGLDLGMRGGLDMGLRGGDMGMGMGLQGAALGMGGLGVGGLGVHANLGMGAGGLMQGGGGHADISPEILAQLGIEGPITNQVFIANLDYQVSRHKLKEVFSLAGKVINAEIKEDKNGKSRGMGIVEFEQPLEAVQAVSMFNGQVLFDRKMMVRVDKVIEEKPMPKLPSGLKSIGMGLGSGGIPLSGLSQASGLGSGAGLGGLGMTGGLGGGMGLGMDLGAGGLGGMGGLGGIPTTMGGGVSLNNLGMGLGVNSMSALGQSNASLGGFGGGNLGLGLGDSLGSSGMGTSKMGLTDSMGMSGLGGGAGLMGAGVSAANMSSLSGLGGAGLGSGIDTGSRGGYERSSRFDSPGRSVGFDDRRGSSFDTQGRGLDVGSRGGLDLGTRGSLDIAGRGFNIGRDGLETGLVSNRGNLELAGQSRFDSLVGRGSLDVDGRGSYDLARGAGLGSIDMGNRSSGFDTARGNYDQGLRAGAYESGDRSGFESKNRGSETDNARGDGRGGRQNPICTVHIKNLPYNLTWQDLRDRFRDIGDVKYAEILTEMGRPSGEAVVRFATVEDALRAISLVDGTRFEGRTVRVTMRN